MSEEQPTPVPKRAPDFHFLMFAPGLQTDWFFVAARRYWQYFRPIVVDETDLIAHIPPDKAVTITTLARSDTASFLRDQIRQDLPDAQHDELIYETLEEAKAALDARADSGARFGPE
ncbi:MAG: hypothetical protein JXB47_07560 [Anaerolineae bacterium]|nr:hypothetical protein [Anaerolineae bacterium]